MKKIKILILLLSISNILFGQSYRVGKTKEYIMKEHKNKIYAKLNIADYGYKDMNGLIYYCSWTNSTQLFFFSPNDVCDEEIILCNSQELADEVISNVLLGDLDYLHDDLYKYKDHNNVYCRLSKGKSKYFDTISEIIMLNQEKNKKLESNAKSNRK